MAKLNGVTDPAALRKWFGLIPLGPFFILNKGTNDNERVGNEIDLKY